MPLRPRALLLALALVAPSGATAQSPWGVTLALTMKPLPIGVCAAVQFALVDPATKDVPRTPSGRRVTIADFDMTVTTADGVSTRGTWIDPSNWRVCACQAAAVGTAGTITASYPGAGVAGASLVPGVAFNSKATFIIGKAQGTYDPPVCTAQKMAVRQPASQPGGVVPPPGTTPAPATPVGIGVVRGASGGRAPATPATSAPVPLPGQTVARSVPTATQPPPVGPAPTNLVVGGGPAEALVQWDPPFNLPLSQRPTGYVVERWKTADPACCRATSPVLSVTATSWYDAMQWPGNWRYRLTAQYADGRQGSAETGYDYRPGVPPTNVVAEQFGRDTVILSWDRDVNVSDYVVTGPPGNVAVLTGNRTQHRFTKVPAGKGTWQVASRYNGWGPSTPPMNSAFVSRTLDVGCCTYRIVAEGIQVAYETVDAPLSTDGKFDEIFVVSRAELITRRNPTSTWGPVRMSAVHGDVTGFLPQKRVQAGSASPQGGIQRGDRIAVWSAPSASSALGAPEFALWEGQLLEGKHDLILHPLIFEWDQPDSDLSRNFSAYCLYQLCNWANYLSGVGSQSSNTPEVKALIAGPVMSSTDGVRIWPGEMSYLERHDRDRPIGLRVGPGTTRSKGISAELFDKVVVFSREKIDAAIANGTNRISVRFWDHSTQNGPPTAVNYLNGDYTLLLRVDRLP